MLALVRRRASRHLRAKSFPKGERAVRGGGGGVRLGGTEDENHIKLQERKNKEHRFPSPRVKTR